MEATQSTKFTKNQKKRQHFLMGSERQMKNLLFKEIKRGPMEMKVLFMAFNKISSEPFE